LDLRTGDAYWPIRDGLLYSYPEVRSDQSAEVVVLGAGITGALIARALSVAGADVLVVDRHDVGMGSTAASTGLLQYATDRPLVDLMAELGEEPAVNVYRLGLGAIDTIESLCREIGDECGFARRPSLYLAAGPLAAGHLAREYVARDRAGFDVTLLSRSAIESFYGFSAAGGLYCGGDAEVDAYSLVHSLVADACIRGARIFDRTTIVKVVAGGAGVVLETDRGHRIRARMLVNAAGYETEEFLNRTGATLHSTWAFATEPEDNFAGWEDRCLIWETARPYFYLRTTDEGRVIGGGQDVASPSRHRDERELIRQTDGLARRLRQMFPAMQADLAYRWGGVFATTADSLPVIGMLPEFPNTWFALGYGGNGITFSVIAADIIRDAYLGQAHPAAGMFGFDRPSLLAGVRA
jgi:glycine/D-amino acid oxidase-like deaminating enzyme